MSAPNDKPLPPLPADAVRALEAFRDERPSAHLEQRLQLALQTASSGRTPARPKPRARLAWLEHRITRGAMGLAVASLVILVAGRVDEWSGDSEVLSETLPLRQVSFQLSEGTPGWLELPWTHAVHSGEPATVHLEAPAELNFHLHAEGLPSVRLMGCDVGRCRYQFTADTGADATPLRVRIDKPGRYEFRVAHASDARQVHEHVVVEASH